MKTTGTVHGDVADGHLCFVTPGAPSGQGPLQTIPTSPCIRGIPYGTGGICRNLGPGTKGPPASALPAGAAQQQGRPQTQGRPHHQPLGLEAEPPGRPQLPGVHVQWCASSCRAAPGHPQSPTRPASCPLRRRRNPQPTPLSATRGHQLAGPPNSKAKPWTAARGPEAQR